MLDGVLLRRLPAAVTLVVGLAACGGGSSTPTNPSAPGPPAQNVDACGAIAGAVSGQTAITNGSTCSAGNTPVVSLSMSNANGSLGTCTGTVIAPRAVLTAAHCLDGGVQTVRVWRGEFPPELIPASSFRAHPNYNPGASVVLLDVGVVRFDRDLGRPALPLLVSRDARAGETAVVAGYGRDLQNVTEGNLRAGVTTLSGVDQTSLRTLYSTMSSGICQGDSGGPILLSEGGTWAIAGIISATSASTCNTGEHFYAKVQNDAIRSFIVEHVPEATLR